jgi:hypothetical protein
MSHHLPRERIILGCRSIVTKNDEVPQTMLSMTRRAGNICAGQRRRGACGETYLTCGCIGCLAKEGMISEAFAFTPEQKQLFASLSHETGTSIPFLMAEALCLFGAKYGKPPLLPRP